MSLPGTYTLITCKIYLFLVLRTLLGLSEANDWKRTERKKSTRVVANGYVLCKESFDPWGDDDERFWPHVLGIRAYDLWLYKQAKVC